MASPPAPSADPTGPESRARVTPPSTYGAVWRDRLDLVAPVAPHAAFGVGRGDRVLVVTAHPDDETLAMGAALAALAADGVEVHVVSLTAGEAALDHVGRRVDGLARRRRQELQRAAHALGARSALALDLPDGALDGAADAAHRAVTEAVGCTDPARLITLWRGDSHPDHGATARAVLSVARLSGIAVVELPLWAVHWADPDDVTYDVVPLDAGATAWWAKARALASYTSQTSRLADDVEPVLPGEVLAWPYECVIHA